MGLWLAGLGYHQDEVGVSGGAEQHEGRREVQREHR
jgi:hypothetical protein